MTSPPDKLFRDRLGQLQKAAPASAWDRIDTNLHQRRIRRIGWRMAASIAILLSVTYLLWPAKTTFPLAVAHQESSSHPAVPQRLTHQALIPDSSTTEPNSDNVIPSPGKKPVLSITLQAEGHALDSTQINTSTGLQDSIKKAIAGIDQAEVVGNGERVEYVFPAEAPQLQTVGFPRTTLVYSAREVNEKFLKSEIRTGATPPAKPASGLKKVMDIAADIKYDDNPLGGLRQKKNEFLSLDFLDRKSEADK